MKDIPNHPALDINKLKPKFRYLPNNFKFIEGNFRDCIVKANIILGNTSNTCLETLALGIQVIIIVSLSGLTKNPITETVEKDIWKLCYTPEELASAINHFLNIIDEERLKFKAIGEKIREEYFEPVTREGVRAFLMLD